MAGRDMGQIRTINDPGIDNTVQHSLVQEAQSKWFSIDTTSTSSHLPQAPPRPGTISQTNGAMHPRRCLFRSIRPYIIGLVGFEPNMPSFLIFLQYNVDQTTSSVSKRRPAKLLIRKCVSRMHFTKIHLVKKRNKNHKYLLNLLTHFPRFLP